MAKSATKISFEMVLPKVIGKSKVDFWNFSEPITARTGTISRFLFATSIPMVSLPGIWPIIRTPIAANESDKSSSREVILLTRTPAFGTISYRVTVGPMVASIF